MKTTLELLQSSPFFEIFEQEHLERLAEHARMRTFAQGEILFEEGSPAKAFHMLVVGRIRLSFRGLGRRSGKSPRADEEESDQVLIRNISEPGRPVGWSAMVEPFRYRARATALQSTQTLVFAADFLERFCRESPQFGVAFMERLLWVVGNRLRATRIRLVAKRYEAEVVAIRALLDQGAVSLSVTSPLHKIPYYLENRLTLVDAVNCLELLQAHGDETERGLADLCLEILENIRDEVKLFHHLQVIYELVANASNKLPPAELRRRCCQEFAQLFGSTRHVIRGEEHLPDGPGHIFIMNHLSNHPDNTLPNDFQLALDTHFVSAMILFKKYGQAPVRVIRKPHPDEFGHQKYYARLGYIYVYRGHVDEYVEEPNISADDRRRLFLDTARAHLLAGYNIVICPEGNCTTTEDSPLPFRSGAFRLALHVQPEPLIVPIAVANFDKKITRTKTVAVIHPPFRLSQFVPNPVRDETLFAFVNTYGEKFEEYVRQAVQLGN